MKIAVLLMGLFFSGVPETRPLTLECDGARCVALTLEQVQAVRDWQRAAGAIIQAQAEEIALLKKFKPSCRNS